MAVKWGVLGTAGIARWATIPGMKKSKNCELYAIAGRDEKKVDAYKKEFGFERDTWAMTLSWPTRMFRRFTFLFPTISTANGS